MPQAAVDTETVKAATEVLAEALAGPSDPDSNIWGGPRCRRTGFRRNHAVRCGIGEGPESTPSRPSAQVASVIF